MHACSDVCGGVKPRTDDQVFLDKFLCKFLARVYDEQVFSNNFPWQVLIARVHSWTSFPWLKVPHRRSSFPWQVFPWQGALFKSWHDHTSNKLVKEKLVKQNLVVYAWLNTPSLHMTLVRSKLLNYRGTYNNLFTQICFISFKKQLLRVTQRLKLVLRSFCVCNFNKVKYTI